MKILQRFQEMSSLNKNTSRKDNSREGKEWLQQNCGNKCEGPKGKTRERGSP